jgi:ribosomal protein L20A (L18A)
VDGLTSKHSNKPSYHKLQQEYIDHIKKIATEKYYDFGSRLALPINSLKNNGA